MAAVPDTPPTTPTESAESVAEPPTLSAVELDDYHKGCTQFEIDRGASLQGYGSARAAIERSTHHSPSADV